MQLLEIHAGIRDAGSVSRELCRHFLEAWEPRQSDTTRSVRDIGIHPPAHPTALFMQANYTPPPERTAEMRATLVESETLIAELLAADRLLLALPIYNFGVPSTFKAWVDNIVRVDRTFSFDSATFTFGPLATGKRALAIVSSAADYRAGSPMAPLDHLTPYVRAIFGFIGIADVRFVYAPNQLAPPEVRAEVMAGAKRELTALAETW
jgi:FMN-dependent NADH-azoreductase